MSEEVIKALEKEIEELNRELRVATIPKHRIEIMHDLRQAKEDLARLRAIAR